MLTNWLTNSGKAKIFLGQIEKVTCLCYLVLEITNPRLGRGQAGILTFIIFSTRWQDETNKHNVICTQLIEPQRLVDRVAWYASSKWVDSVSLSSSSSTMQLGISVNCDKMLFGSIQFAKRQFQCARMKHSVKNNNGKSAGIRKLPESWLKSRTK